MNFLNSLTIALTFVLMLVLALERLMGVFFEKRRTSLLVTVGSYALYYILFSLTFALALSLLHDYSLLRIIVVLIINVIGNITYFIITLNYESSLGKRLIAAICSYLFITASMGMIILIWVLVVGGNLDLISFEEAGVSGLQGMLLPIGGFITYIISALLRRHKHIKKNSVSAPVFWIASVVIPAFSSAIIVTTVMLFLSVGHIPQMLLIVFVLLFAINLLTFYLQDTLSAAYEDKLKSTLHAQEKEYYFSQCQLMQASVDKVKSIHHDMKSHLATARDYIANNRADEATDYLDSLLGDISEIESYSDTGNIAFDSIINFKLKNILEDGIKLDVKIFVPPALNIEMADVVTILGNLLDNALDAVAKVEDKRIKLKVESTKGNLFIKIENTFDGVVEYAKDGQAIVTRKDGDKHGYGLKNIRKSVEKYDGHVDIHHEDNIFSVGILLYV